MSLGNDGIIFWYSTLGRRDSHDFATRGYLRSLRGQQVNNIRVPPFSNVISFDRDTEEFQYLMRPPKSSAMKPLVRVQKGDPRIGKTWKVKSGDVEYEAPIEEGAVDLEVEQEISSSPSNEVGLVLFHHDPSGICRHFMTLTGAGKPPEVSYGGITVWETSHIPDSVARILSELDFLITPSDFCADVFRNSGVECEIATIRHTFDVKQWPDPTIQEMQPNNHNEFVFYNIGTPIERKNHLGLVKAYVKAFQGNANVVLRIKSNGPIAYSMLTEMIKGLPEILKITESSMPKIEIYCDDWPQREMRRFHMEGDCFVSATRGEGFGLCEMEAKLCGRQVITTGFGACKELLGANDMLVDYKEINVDGMYNLGCYESDQLWGDPDENDLIEKMRRACKLGPLRDYHSWGRLHKMLRPERIGKQLSDLIAKHRK